MDVPNFNTKQVTTYHQKIAGKLKILFISSIVEIKNLNFVIETLNKIGENFTLDIYGPIKDERYWHKCLKTINPKIKEKVVYKGEIHNDEIYKVYPNYDLLFLPTFSESFGHVVWESLVFGCPVLTTDQTPWYELEKFNAGWNFPLQEEKLFINIIELLIPMDNVEYKKYRAGCKNYVEKFQLNKDNLDNNFTLFEIT